jgi:hypothetical protein
MATKTQSELSKAASYRTLFGHRQEGAIWFYSLIRYIKTHTYILTVSRKRKLNDDSGLYEYS